MFSTEFVVSFAISLALTAFVYGLAPILLLLFHQSPISHKKLKWFHIIYTVVISLIFNFSAAMLGYQCNFTPALIWGLIFYNINKSQFKKREPAIPCNTYAQHEAQMRQFVVDDATGEIISETPAEDPKPVVLSYAPDFKLSGPPQPVQDEAPQEPAAPPKPSKKSRTLCILLAMLCTASLAGNVVQGYLYVQQRQTYDAKQEELQKEISRQEGLVTGLKKSCVDFREQVQKLEKENREYSSYFDEHIFLNHNIGLIVEGSNYYHNYHCPVFESADTYWAHNIEYCKYLGYSECPTCYSDDFNSNSSPEKLPRKFFYIN